ncbi:Hypothetical protein CINCED_3A006774, partial [Cinara cedri]
MEIDIDEEKSKNVQSKVVNSCDSVAIDKNKIEEQTMEFDVEKKKSKMYNNCKKSWWPDDAINIIEEPAVGLYIEELNPIDIQPAVVRNLCVPDDAINIIEEPTLGLYIEEQNPFDIQTAILRNPCVSDDALNLIEGHAVMLDIEEQNPIDIQQLRHAVVRNPGVPDNAINIIEEQAVGLDIEEQNPIYIQPKVVNSCDSAAIDKNKIEEQSMEFDVEEKNENNVEPCSTSTAESPELDENSSSETTMFHECKGRRFQFKKGSDIDNQATIAFINDFIMTNRNATWLYSDNETFANDGTKEEIVNNHNGAVIVKNKYEEQTMELNMEEENQTNVQS